VNYLFSPLNFAISVRAKYLLLKQRTMFFFEIWLTEMAVWNSEHPEAYTGLLT